MIGFVDRDDTLCEFVTPLLKLYNQHYRDNITKDDIKDWDIHQFLDERCKNIFMEFVCEDFLYHTKLMPYAKQVLNDLHNNGVEIYFSTATHPTLVEVTHNKLKDTFLWYTYKNLIPISNKTLLCGDFMIDDAVHNLQGENVKTKILMSQPWNKECKLSRNTYRCSDWLGINHVLNKVYGLYK